MLIKLYKQPDVPDARSFTALDGKNTTEIPMRTYGHEFENAERSKSSFLVMIGKTIVVTALLILLLVKHGRDSGAISDPHAATIFHCLVFGSMVFVLAAGTGCVLFNGFVSYPTYGKGFLMAALVVATAYAYLSYKAMEEKRCKDAANKAIHTR